MKRITAPKKHPDLEWAHQIRLSAADKKALEDAARKHCRTVTLQILIYVRKGLELETNK